MSIVIADYDLVQRWRIDYVKNGCFLGRSAIKKEPQRVLQTLVLRMRLFLVLAVPLWKFGFLLLLFLHVSTLLSF